MNGKADYQPWREEDFQADTDVRLSLDWLQRLLYKQLCNSAWVCSTRPDLPDDDSQLWKLAGCSKEIWEQNKEPIKSLFSEEDGLLFRKKIREDWGKLVNYRKAASEGGRQSATKRWGEPAKLYQKELNPLKLVPSMAIEILGAVDKSYYYEKDLKDLTKTYGGTAVVNAFESWAKSFTGDTDKPISKFCKIADQYINLKPKHDHPDLDLLASSLYAIGNHPFSGSARSGLLTLLESYTLAEIKSAYSTFVTTRDDYSMKFAPRDFVTGAGKDIIEASKQKKVKEDEVQSLIAQQVRLGQQEVSKKLQELNSEEIEEHL